MYMMIKSTTIMPFPDIIPAVEGYSQFKDMSLLLPRTLPSYLVPFW